MIDQGMVAPLSAFKHGWQQKSMEKGDIKMRAAQQIILAVLISLTLIFSGGAVAQAQDWQNQKQREKPREKEKEQPKKDEKKDEKRDEGKKKPY